MVQLIIQDCQREKHLRFLIRVKLLVQRQSVHLIFHVGVQVHQLITNAEIVILAQLQKALTFVDCPVHHTAGDQGVKIGIADAHIRSGLENLPERANVLFEMPLRFQLLCGGFHELLQCRKLLIHLVFHRMDDQLKLRVNIVRLQFQRLAKIFDALLFGCSLLRKIQIIVGGFRSSVFIDRADALL